MHEFTLARRVAVRNQIRAKHNSELIAHMRKADSRASDEPTLESLSSDQLERVLLRARAQLVGQGLEESRDCLKELLEVSTKSNAVEPWFSSGVVQTMVDYLKGKEMSLFCARLVLNVLSRLVVNSQTACHSAQLEEMGLLPVLLVLLDEPDINEQTLHLISNLCGDSFHIRNKLVVLGLTEKMATRFLDFERTPSARRVFAWSLSNVAKPDQQSHLPTRTYRILAHYAAKLLLVQDAHAANNAAFAAQFLAESVPGLEMLLQQQAWLPNSFRVIRQLRPNSVRVMISLGKAASNSTQASVRLLRDGLLDVIGEGMQSKQMSVRLQQLSGWVLGCLMTSGYKTIQSLLRHPLIYALQDQLSGGEPQVLKQLAFLTCDICCKASINQLQKLLALPWVLEFIEFSLCSEEQTLQKQGLLALLVMSHNCRQYYSSTSSNYLLPQLRARPVVLVAVEGLTSSPLTEVRQLAQHWVQNYLGVQ